MYSIEKNASTPQPLYYAVIFTSLKINNEGYNEASERMLELASLLEVFLGVESFRNDSGFGVSISYWTNLDDIKGWKNNFEHLLVQKKAERIGISIIKSRSARLNAIMNSIIKHI